MDYLWTDVQTARRTVFDNAMADQSASSAIGAPGIALIPPIAKGGGAELVYVAIHLAEDFFARTKISPLAKPSL